jgi:Flp pilus assembly protein TadD
MMPRYRFKRCAWIRSFVVIVLFGLNAGCAGTGSTSRPDEGNESTPSSETAGPVLEADGEFGFTVTEVVRIDSDVRTDYQNAVALLRQNRLDEGITLLEAVVERATEVTTPHIDLGAAYSRIGANDKAEQSLQAALALAPNHPVALNELGIVYRRTGKFAAARESYERALGVHPGFHFALRNLGVLCDLYLEDLGCALQNYESYAEIVGDDAQVEIWIADIRNRLGVAQ